MKVLFDNLGFEDQAFGGVTRYFTEIIRHFPAEIETLLPVIETANVYLQAAPFRIPAARWSFQQYFPRTHFRGKHLSFKILSRLISPFVEGCEIKNRRRFLELLAKDEFDVLHLTRAHMYGRDWMPAVGKKPIVVTIHDLIPDKIQGLKRFQRERRRILPFVTRFIAVSENTKSDLVDEYGVDPDLIDVVYHGPSEILPTTSANLPALPPHYILFVGGRGGYKNFGFFAKSIAPWLRNRPSMKLVCTGAPFTPSERKMLADAGVLGLCEARFFPNEELPSLYEHAFAFVFPSVYEGFGIPILDAFRAGCPVLLNRASCFPEIGGDAALYFADGNEESLVRQLDRLESEPELRKELREKALQRVKAFSWAKAAKETARSYRKALDSFRGLH